MSEPPAIPPLEIAVPGRDGFLPCPSGRSLYCVSHFAPAGGERARFLFLQACSEERKASHRTAVRLAGALAAAGVTTHRIDLPGCGESTGIMAELRLADWRSDAEFAAQTLLAGSGGGTAPNASTWVGGLRMGATVAGLCDISSWREKPPRWLAIAPILQGANWLRQMRTRRSIRSEITGSTATVAGADGIVAKECEDFDGFLLNAGMLADLEALDLAAQHRRLNGGIVVQAGAAKTVTKEFAALRNREKSEPLTVVAVRQEPVWERGEGVQDGPLIEAVAAAAVQALAANES